MNSSVNGPKPSSGYFCFNPKSLYCWTNRSAAAPLQSAQTASGFACWMRAKYGAKSAVSTGA